MKLWIAAIFVLLAGFVGNGVLAGRSHAQQSSFHFCSPNQSCWPSQAEWDALNKEVHGHLSKGSSPLLPCLKDTHSRSCQAILKDLNNPYFIESQSGATQSSGWIGAWQSTPSSYVVAVESAQEIADTVNFARYHRIKLVIKGTGHDYLGRSNAPNSLLIWTHHMRNVTFQDHFIPAGCSTSQTPTSAVTVQAGTRWIEAYKAVTVDHGQYVQGGGCTTVGAAGGFIQGGGFGSFSKKFGTGAAGLLEAEVVTADGKIRIANACQNQDLYWALKGGGGGTYGVVSKVTLQTHPLPLLFGVVNGTITAQSDAAYQELINYFISFYRENLNNEYWGEQVSFTPNNEIKLALVFQGMNKDEVDKLWQPFTEWLAKNPNQYQVTIHSSARPAKTYWDFDYLAKNIPDAIGVNKMENAPRGEFWWVPNQAEVSMYLTHYLSTYLPFNLFSPNHAKRLAKTLFEASRFAEVTLHFNKGLSGASSDAILRQKNTAMNPAVIDAAALVIIAGGQSDTYANVSGHEPDLMKARASIKQAEQAMKLLYNLNPNANSYPNETDYFISHWQSALWGSNYNRLLQIKRKYDPQNLFTCHHCVGS